MSLWSDIAVWRGPTPNHGGPMVAHRGVVLHIAEGYYEGTVSWCLNPDAGVSAHFVVGKGGKVAQLVDTGVRSWCQAAGNAEWLSIENEGYAGDSLTPEQVEACARILAKAHRVHGVPMVVATSPAGRGLGHHSMGGAAWGGHDRCPGVKVIAQKTLIVRRAQELAGGTVSPSTDWGDEDDMRSLMRHQDSPHVFLTDGLVARWVTSEAEIADLRTLGGDGTIRLGYGGKIRIVTRRELVGRIVGVVPSGWEDQTA